MTSSFTKTIIATASLLSFSACATIIEGQTQSISVNTSTNQPANCQLSNERGSWAVQAPTEIEVKRSVSRLNIACRDYHTSGTQEERATVNPWYFGNVIFGGLIGLAIDPITGAMAKYDNNIRG